MAERSKTEEDPSIEEILDSIRRIISDDVMEEPDDGELEPVAAAAPEPPKPEPVVAAPPPRKPEPVVAAPEPKKPEPVVVTPEPEPVVTTPDSEPEEVLVLTEKVEDEAMSFEPEPDPVEEEFKKQPLQVDLRDVLEEKTKPAPVPEIDVGFDEALFSDKVEEEAYQAISGLARKVALGRGSTTLEEIVRQELKPLLRGWLHQNLSSVIDRLVREELERVSNRVLED